MNPLTEPDGVPLHPSRESESVRNGGGGVILDTNLALLPQPLPEEPREAAAVTTDNGILFFDSNWRKISSAAHQYSRISAFAYDEVLGKLYFADLDHPEYRLFALDYDDTDELHKVTKLLPKSAQTAYISGMAFDHLERRLYWTEKGTRSVYYVAIDDLLSSTRSAAAAANGTAAAAA
uniref:Uncharacterized protein n=1 Tax=Anopheles melas TaxID=34690 RepID=A0A182U2N8_9DIPT